jgi:hypothetical protein
MWAAWRWVFRLSQHKMTGGVQLVVRGGDQARHSAARR